MKSLNEVFAEPVRPASEGVRADGQPAPEPTPAPEPAPETGDKPEQKAEPTRDERGKFAPKPESPPPGEAAEKPQAEKAEARSTHVPLQALEDERRKRQELEREATQLREWHRQYQEAVRQAQMRQHQAAPQPQPEQPQPLAWDWENPDKPLQTLQQQLAQTAQEAKQAADMAAWQRHVRMSVHMARTTHPDYDDMETAFIEVARRNPALIQQMYAHDHPGEFAYEVGRQARALSEIGDPVAYRQRIEAEARAKWEAERAESLAAQPAVHRPASLPRTLADARAAPGSSRSSSSTANRPPITSIFPR